ncbi:peptidoglycan DD-metalloendopeptidase family protein [Streptomyces sp. NPDC006649]|uniref:M23 family metallopeptidase n=1 Tax=Streptomyces sp. NPDC006649 TaxID=3156896 RepID=UPI0033A676E4
MNDQQTHAGYVGYDDYSSGSPTGTFAVDPLFGDMPGGYPSGPHAAHQAGHSGEYDATQWDTGAHQTLGNDGAYQPTGQWPVQPQAQAQAQAQSYGYPAQTAAGHDTAGHDTTGQWDAGAWNANTNTGTRAGQFENADATQQWLAQSDDAAPYDTGAYDTGAYSTDTYSTGTYNTGAYGADTGDHDATARNSTGEASEATPHATQQFAAIDLPGNLAAGDADVKGTEHTAEFAAFTEPGGPGESGGPGEFGQGPVPTAPHLDAPLSAARRAAGGRGGRRRTPAKRSALLTIAVPSVCVMGVAGVAAATVGGIGESGKDSGTATQVAADPSSVKPVAANSKLDSQLADLSHEADDFADRASRTQERLDLKQRQATAKKKAEEEAARKEAARPKFVLPVTQKGLSAYFGQAGVNWMSVHTGIDFPVSYGTPVMAATDGTVRTQWNSAYGNMAMVTSPDGTETWYCHLSSTKIRSGPVKAGDVIAYSGNSGNSTGPHMHFEVRPHSGAAIDPLPWLRSHGLDPT